jgi:hypothetical protein
VGSVVMIKILADESDATYVIKTMKAEVTHMFIHLKVRIEDDPSLG